MKWPKRETERVDVPTEPNDVSAALSVRLFGELELRLGDERLPRLESAQGRSLLAFLLLHRDAPQSRHRLAFMLWPDSNEAQALTNLRHLIHTLRQASPELDQFLDVTSQTLQWREDASSWIDIAAFDAAQAAADAPGLTARRELEALRTAIDLYRGDLLEGCYDEWVLDVRERFRDRYLSHLLRLAEVLASDGDHAEAIRVGRELLRNDPLREETCRFLMRVHVAAGDRAAAVRVFHECVSTLQRELGVEPSAETLVAYAALTHSEPGAAEPQPKRIAESVLVGREREWEQLTSRWHDVEKGHTHLVLVSGEPGVGKTRLAEEFAAWSAHRGALVATARSYPTEGNLGFGTAISWLRTPELAGQLRQMAARDLAVLGRLLPEFDDASQSLRPEDVDASEDRRRLFETIASSLFAGGRPVVLIADDVQWCDEQSLQLMHYLVRLDTGNPLLIVATARREDVNEGSPAGSLFAGLQMIERATEVAVRPLTPSDAAQLLRHLVSSEIDASSLDDLYADTEGNPLFIVEAVRAGWSGVDRGVTKLSPKLQAVIGSRLRHLTQPARDLLGVAATIGREFNATVLAKALTLDDVTLVGGLDELWRRGIIREHGTDSYDFAHGKIRDVAYDALSPAAVRRNHRLIAEALITIHGHDLDEVSGEIARHLDSGARHVEAIEWYRRAATRAQRMHADSEAIRLLDRAHALIMTLPVSDERLGDEFEVLSTLVTPLAVTDGYASARVADVQARSIELAGLLHIEPSPSLLRSMTMSNLCRADFNGAGELALRLLTLAAREDDEVLRIESEYLLGIGAFWNGAFEAARGHFESAVDNFDPLRRVEHLVRFGHDPSVVCLSRLANTLWFLGSTDEARATRDEAVRLAADVAHPFSRGVALVFAALLCVDLDESDLLRGFVDELAVDAEHRPSAVATEALAGYLEVLDGRCDSGIQRIRGTIDVSSANPRAIDHAPGQRAAHTRLLLGAYLLANEPRLGLAACDEALAAGGTRIWEPEARRLRAIFLAALNSPPELIEAELTRAAVAAEHFGALGPQRQIARTRSELGLTG